MQPSILSYLWNLICNQARRLFLPYLLRRSHKYPKLNGGPNVQRLTDSIVLKSNQYDLLCTEAAAIRFVARNTSIPVPEIFDIWQPRGRKYACMAMSFMEGETLARVWKRLTGEQRIAVLGQLSGYIRQLRALSPPRAGWIGNVGFQRIYDRLYGTRGPGGPFQSEAEFNDSHVSVYTHWGSDNPEIALKLVAIRRAMRDDHQICFTHGDLFNRNILVSVDGPEPEDVKITAILDWEQAGWRPEYWEAVKLAWVNGSSWEYTKMARELVVPGYDEEIRTTFDLSYIVGPGGIV
ncbi:hypothetical protein BDN72DRAFT_834148 [Pluteus cervinus]|uniref:Uncharacterized protein n=1 Tax=Pluteus cervinus TaxID=181527 RepID=A0ACD3B7L0_9AGAR|nr:hypothetical protein BDN72DRAFT_834148 [Pluteus cervinus]